MIKNQLRMSGLLIAFAVCAQAQTEEATFTAPSETAAPATQAFAGTAKTMTSVNEGRDSGFASFMAEQCPFAISKDVGGIVDEVKAAIQARAEDAKCSPLQQTSAALTNSGLRNTIRVSGDQNNGRMGYSGGGDDVGATCATYVQVHNFELRYLASAQTRGLKQSYSKVAQGCDFEGDTGVFRACLEQNAIGEIERWALRCSNARDERIQAKEDAAVNSLYQNGLATTSALIDGSVRCEDKDIMRGLLKLGVGSLALTASAGPYAMAAVGAGRLINSIIDRFGNKNAKFVRDLTDKETVANFQCLQFFVTKKAFSCDSQLVSQNGKSTCDLDSNQLENLREIASSIRNVSGYLAEEKQNESKKLAAMNALTDGLLRQAGNKVGLPLRTFLKPELLASEPDLQEYFQAVKDGQRLSADKMAALAPKILKIKGMIEFALNESAKIDSLEKAEMHARFMALTNPNENLHTDADTAMLLASHSKFTTSFREKFMSILKDHRASFDANQANTATRKSLGMTLYQTCRLNAGAYLFGDEKGQTMSINSPQRNKEFQRLCGEFLRCDHGTGKSFEQALEEVYSGPPSTMSNRMQAFQCEVMNFGRSSDEKVRKNLENGTPPCP